MYVDCIQRGDVTFSWIRTTNGDLEFTKSPSLFYLFQETDEESGIKSIFGKNLKRIDFDDYESYKDFRKSNSNLHESDISPLYKFLSDKFHNLTNKNLNICYFDIEVDFDLSWGFGYPTPHDPFGEVNSISMFDCKTQTYHMIILNKMETNKIFLSDSEHNVIVHECVTERQLFDVFVRLIDHVDILSAWNGDNFDIPYIIKRMMKIYGNSEGLKLLCRNGFKAIEQLKTDDYGNEVINYDLVGRVHLDMMKVYKNSTFGERSSYSLNYIVEYENVGRKIDYTGDLGELFRTDPQKFFEYSLHDSRLLYELDKKMRIIELSIIRAQSSTIKYNDVFGSIRPLEMKIRNYVHFIRDEKLALPDNFESEKEKFEGAFVVPTKQGIYGYSTSVDLGSLYPSVMRAINISPDSHLFQCENKREDFIKVVECSDEVVNVISVKTGESLPTTGKSINQFIKNHNLTISAYGSIFSEHKGLLPEILDIWVTARKEAKEKMFEYQDLYNIAVANNESDERLKSLNDKIDFYNIKQLLAKLDNNSLYGAISNAYCRFYTIYCAASITLSGQIIEKHQIYTADQLVKKKIEEMK